METFKKINKSNTTVYHENKGVGYITFNRLDELPFIRNAFSTRKGGISSGVYSSMNLSFTKCDNEDDVLKNFKIFGNATGFDTENMVYSKQTHTTNVIRVDESYRGMGVLRDRNFTDIDGLVTNAKNLVLVTSYADCVPLYFVDPVVKAIGLSHSGWRGTVNNMAGVTVRKMQEEFGSDPENIITCIGPSICSDCYEISEDVADEFRQKYSETEIQDILLPGKKPGKYQLNLHKANYYNMINAGILKANIAVTDICTCCNSDILFSHRASNGERGGLCAFLSLV